jgi:hypothetical protein
MKFVMTIVAPVGRFIMKTIKTEFAMNSLRKVYYGGGMVGVITI